LAKSPTEIVLEEDKHLYTTHT